MLQFFLFLKSRHVLFQSNDTMTQINYVLYLLSLSIVATSVVKVTNNDLMILRRACCTPPSPPPPSNYFRFHQGIPWWFLRPMLLTSNTLPICIWCSPIIHLSFPLLKLPCLSTQMLMSLFLPPRWWLVHPYRYIRCLHASGKQSFIVPLLLCLLL